jgi:hypothetical protein
MELLCVNCRIPTSENIPNQFLKITYLLPWISSTWMGNLYEKIQFTCNENDHTFWRGDTYYTPLIIGCKDKYFQGIVRYQLYVTQFKIQDLGLEDHIKVDSTSWTICKSMINFMHNNVFNHYISRCGSYVGH